MNKIQISYRTPGINDIEIVLELMQKYYQYENIPFDKQIVRNRLKDILKNKELGKIWLIIFNGVNVGYIVVTNGFGLEHGRNVIIDEFYIDRNFRGQGIGLKTIQYIEEELRKIGISSIHTEVERKNKKTQKFWNRLGFEKFNRYPMVKMIDET